MTEQNNQENDFKGSRGFLMIPVAIARDPDLLANPKSILLMGEIISMLNVTGQFYMSNTPIARRLNCSTSMVKRYLKTLEDKGYIERTKIYAKDNPKIIKGRYITAGKNLIASMNLGWAHTCTYPRCTDEPTPRGIHAPTLGAQMSHKENNIREQYKRTNKNICSSDDKRPSVSQLEQEFESLWKKYPNKKGKKEAFNHYKAWRKKSKKHTPEYISQRLDAYIQQLQIDHTPHQYILYGSTWFNGRFDDKLDVDQSSQLDHGGFDPRLLADSGNDPSVDTDDLPF